MYSLLFFQTADINMYLTYFLIAILSCLHRVPDVNKQKLAVTNVE